MALTRKLKDYRWELRGNKVALIDKRENKEIVIDKVRLVSFMKFAPNCIDKMRIEEGKTYRKRLADMREKLRIEKARKSKSAIQRKLINEEKTEQIQDN